MKKNETKERRSHARFLTEVRAQCYHVLSDGTAEKATARVTGTLRDTRKKPQSKGVVCDVSFGGLYLESIRPFREGTILVIEMVVPKQKSKLVIIGLVRWTRAIQDNPPYQHGMGVQFIYMQEADWETIQKLAMEEKTVESRRKSRIRAKVRSKG